MKWLKEWFFRILQNDEDYFVGHSPDYWTRRNELLIVGGFKEIHKKLKKLT